MVSDERLQRIIAIGTLVSLYLGSRLFYLLRVPVFVDEAFHIERARWASQGSLQTGAGLGKWLSIQAYGVWLRLFGDSLLAARLLVVVVGLITLLVLFWTASSYDSQSHVIRGFLAGLVYVVSPLALFYDRQALTDEFQTLLFALIVLACFRFVALGTRRWAAAIGALVALAPLLKTSGILLAVVPVLIVFFAAEPSARRGLTRTLFLPLGAAFAVIGLYVALSMAFVTTTETIGMTAWGSPGRIMESLLDNGVEELEALSRMLTPSMLLVLAVAPVLVAVYAVEESVRRRTAALVVMVVTQLVLADLLYGDLHTRYLIPVLVPIAFLATEGVVVVWHRFERLPQAGRTLAKALVVILAFLMPAVASVRLLTSPQTFRLSTDDRRQYYAGWTSGYGTDQVVARLSALAEHGAGRSLVLQTPEVWSLPMHRRELGANVDLVTLDSWAKPSMESEVRAYLGERGSVYLVHDEAASDAKDDDAITRLKRVFGMSELMRTSRLDGSAGFVVWELSVRP